MECHGTASRIYRWIAGAVALAGVLLPAVALAAGVESGSDGSKAHQLRMSVASGPALPLGSAAQRWSALLADADPRLLAKLHPGGSLAGRDPARELLALQEGSADLAVGSALWWSTQVPALAVFGLPWIAPTPRELEALVANQPLVDALAGKLDAAGVVLVALAPLGHRQIATTARPVRAPEDLDGLRVRAAPMPLVHDTLLSLGVRPQAMSFAEAQAAFAKGALDGQEGPPSSLEAARAHASGQRHLTEWGALADAMVFAVHKPLWTSWDETQRETARRTARQAIAETAALAREEAAVNTLARNGISVLRLTPAGHAVFRAVAKDVVARWREAIGTDLVTLAERALAEAKPAGPK